MHSSQRIKSLSEYADMLKGNNLIASVNLHDNGDEPVTSITYDSRDAKNGCLFVCKGAAFKKNFLENAINDGCIGYVSETDYIIDGVPCIIVKNIRDAMPPIARMFYDIPQSLKIIGVTGTKGKTTTAYYLKAIFDEAARTSGGHEAAFITTVETYDGKERISTGITTPEAFELYRHFRNASDSGIEYVVMEVSSQALKYKRTEGILFDTGIFLNISEDHISPMEHSDFEDYINSKLKIFSQCKTALVCADTDKVNRVLNAAKNADETTTFGINENADIAAFNVNDAGAQTAFTVKYNRSKYDFLLNMGGNFNVENALAAIGTAFKYGISYEAMYEALKKVSVPGRGEEYSSRDGNINVIVDYAHNGLSFRNIIGAAKRRWHGRKIITLFGCVGGKALNRREDMGLTAGEMSDRIYLTADDPATESISDICAQVGSYIEKTGCPYEVIEDRAEAVSAAILSCNEPSVVLLLGKGSEKTQRVAHGTQPYISDAVAAQEALSKYDNMHMKNGG